MVAASRRNGDWRLAVWAYDDLGRVTSEKMVTNFGSGPHWPLTEGELSSLSGETTSYAYDDVANKVTVTEPLGESVYEYDSRGFLVSYTPAQPSGYGTIRYEWDNLGRKTSMIVPLGFSGADNARKISYRYKADGTPDGMDITPETVDSGTALSSATAEPTDPTEFYYDSSGNRVKMVTKANATDYAGPTTSSMTRRRLSPQSCMSRGRRTATSTSGRRTGLC